ncbi:alpha/beta fold hydrolase [Nonomuraea fuscirosea]|uniref:alpha/beta fold hydrolase n=1 Tax=Nonomuraea fuscirosea TaxID=1291556 RepID=UPI0033FD44E8
MTVVLVHGVPETSAVWDPLRAVLRRDDVRVLGLPGFGRPRPEGFTATKEEYVAWLTAELEDLAGQDVDLVGHDWGGGLVVRLVSLRPDLVRSWVTDAAGLGHADFRWHDLARLWQTPGAGEQFFERRRGLPVEELALPYEGFGVPREHALAMAAEADEVMAGSILALYRSAVDVGREWSPAFAGVPVPGLVLVASEDPFLDGDAARAAAARAGAAVAELPGLGHWWLLQDPAAGAARLEEFWDSLAQ